MTTTTGAPVVAPRQPRSVVAEVQLSGRRTRQLPWLPVVGVALLAVLVRLPFLRVSPSPDEGGFLMVAAQWRPGTSLYGDYWVDRPPLLIAMLQPVAGSADPVVGLRLLGCVAVVMAVVLAARLGHLLDVSSTSRSLEDRAGRASRWTAMPVVCAAAAAVFADCPLFGASYEVDGELLSLPFVLGSLVLSLSALRAHERRTRLGLWAGAGATALAAVAVKQSMLDGFVVAATLVVWLAFTSGRRRAWEAAAAVAVGAGLTLAALLGWAAVHGTSPGPLWDAVVTFRSQAGAVIAASAPATNDARARTLIYSFLASGAGLILVSALLPSRRPRRSAGLNPDPRLLLIPLLGWEVLAVALGGSYWLHYLIGLIPGLVLAITTIWAHQPRRRTLVAVALAWATVLTIVIGTTTLHDAGPASGDVTTEQYLIAHQRPGDTGVVAFGNPAILQAASLPSPYPLLWSLPVRVRDPRLSEFTAVLTSAQPPTWVIVGGETLTTWGVDSASAQAVFDRNYELRTVIGDWHVYHVLANRSGSRQVGQVRLPS